MRRIDSKRCFVRSRFRQGIDFLQGPRDCSDYSKRLNLKRNDMIGDLGNAFDSMMQQIETQSRTPALLNERLLTLARTDALSGLANRRVFDEILEKEWRRMRREQQPFGLIVCDIDHFKLYNDTHGHLKGDNCIRAIAVAFSSAARRPADVAARYGGEDEVPSEIRRE